MGWVYFKVTYTIHIPADIFDANVKEIVDQEYLYLILLKIQYVFVVVSTVPKLWAGWQMIHGLIAGEGKDFCVLHHLDGLRSRSSVLFSYQGVLALEEKMTRLWR